MENKSVISELFTPEELEVLKFTDEELEIFRLRARGKTVIEISFTMTDLHGKELPTGYYTVSKVEDRIRKIKKKMVEVL